MRLISSNVRSESGMSSFPPAHEGQSSPSGWGCAAVRTSQDAQASGEDDGRGLKRLDKDRADWLGNRDAPEMVSALMMRLLNVRG